MSAPLPPKETQFKLGQSGNPNGRPKGLEKRVRELLGSDIDGMIYVQRCVALGIPPNPDEMVALGVKLTDDQRAAIKATFAFIKVRDVNEATKNLEDRGWGKAKQTVKINDGSGTRMPKNMPAMGDAQLEALAALDEGLDGFSDDELEGIDVDEPGHGATEH